MLTYHEWGWVPISYLNIHSNLPGTNDLKIYHTVDFQTPALIVFYDTHTNSGSEYCPHIILNGYAVRMCILSLGSEHNSRYARDIISTYWGRDKMTAIFQTTVSNGFSWMKMCEFRLKFVLKDLINNIPSLVQIMAWRRQATSYYLNQWWLVCWRIYASFCLNELNVFIEWMTFYSNFVLVCLQGPDR